MVIGRISYFFCFIKTCTHQAVSVWLAFPFGKWKYLSEEYYIAEPRSSEENVSNRYAANSRPYMNSPHPTVPKMKIAVLSFKNMLIAEKLKKKKCKEESEYHLYCTTSIAPPGNDPHEYLDADASRI